MRLTDLRPGWRTDVMLHRHGGLVLEREDCVVVRTPANPQCYCGNFLLLPQAPRDGDRAHGLARCEAEITQREPASLHVALGVNAPPQGEALWFGVWCGGVLAAGCVLMREQSAPAVMGLGPRTARFQHLGTHPGWRRPRRRGHRH